ncbi:hypothetical protein BGX27_004563 [Mortierella sp. AM989]|nr:hypothetical protein BGX27_004563 [Mortierella sp. AM989]
MKLSTAISALLIIGTANVFAATESPNTVACRFSNPANNMFTLSAPGIVSPYPVCQGTEHCLTLTGTLKEPIIAPASLSFITRFSMNNITAGGSEHDLCALLAAQGTPCPVPVTTTSLRVCVPIEPRFPTIWVFDMQSKARNGNGNPIFCETSTIRLSNCTATA